MEATWWFLDKRKYKQEFNIAVIGPNLPAWSAFTSSVGIDRTASRNRLREFDRAMIPARMQSVRLSRTASQSSNRRAAARHVSWPAYASSQILSIRLAPADFTIC